MENYNDPASAGLVGLIFGVLLIPLLVAYVIAAIGAWKVFEKAGKPGWAAIIPIYNGIVLLEIVGKPVWWIVLFFIPCVNYVFIIWTLNLLSKSFGQSEGFTIGLFLLWFIFFPILGFGNYQYLGPSAAEAQGNRGPFNPNNFRDPFGNNPGNTGGPGNPPPPQQY